MIDLILTVGITFLLILFTAILISYCKRKQNRTRHGLTGMCHQSGGKMCNTCSSQLQQDAHTKERAKIAAADQ